jgi:hypothetical protein
MLASVRTLVLLTHHFRAIDNDTGTILGALSDQQAKRARELVDFAGQPIQYVSLPQMAHAMHGHDPELFAKILTDWSQTLT